MSIITSSSRRRKDNVQRYAMHKRYCAPIADMLQQIGYQGRADRMRDCANRLMVRRCQHCGEIHVTGGNLCRDRLCPVCQWRLSIRRYAELKQSMDYLHTNGALQGLQAGMLTLTVRNCKPHDLSATLSQMLTGFKRWQQRRTIRDQIKGWARSLEITYNRKAQTFHPHVHLLILWQPGGKSGHLGPTMAREWATACRLNYKPIYHYTDAYSRDGVSNWDAALSAILECSKYVTKASDIIGASSGGDSMPLAHFAALTEAIKGRRLIAYGGIIADARKALALPDDDTTLDDQTEAEQTTDAIACPKCGAEMGITMLEWAGVGADGKYIPAAAGYIV